MNITIIGAGRAGGSFLRALTRVGHDVDVRHHDESLTMTAACDLVLICVPDDHISDVASRVIVAPETVVAHCAGSRTLSVLGAHARVASLHPLVALSDADTGAKRLSGATYCVSGDELVRTLVRDLAGRTLELDDADRAAYHATACVAANHLVALLGHVGRLAESVGLELEDFLPLAASALADVERVGPRDALTGPTSRGDLSTIDSHLAAIDETERATYVALASAALTLAEGRAAILARR